MANEQSGGALEVAKWVAYERQSAKFSLDYAFKKARAIARDAEQVLEAQKVIDGSVEGLDKAIGKAEFEARGLAARVEELQRDIADAKQKFLTAHAMQKVVEEMGKQ